MLVAAPIAFTAAPIEVLETIGTIADARLPELSGMAPSRAHAGVYWGVNDSGHPPELFAFTRAGKIVARVAVSGVRNSDWEDLSWLDDDGRRLLVIADTGDNLGLRRHVALHLIPEPALDASTVAPQRSVNFTYEDGARDVESVAVDLRARQFLLIEKRLTGGGLYTLPLNAADGAVAHRVATLPAFVPEAQAPSLLDLLFHEGAATSMDLSPDGERVALLTYTHLMLFRRGSGSWLDALRRAPARWIRLPSIPGFESVSFDGDGVLIGAEGEPAPLWRWTPGDNR